MQQKLEAVKLWDRNTPRVFLHGPTCCCWWRHLIAESPQAAGLYRTEASMRSPLTSQGASRDVSCMSVEVGSSCAVEVQDSVRGRALLRSRRGWTRQKLSFHL